MRISKIHSLTVRKANNAEERVDQQQRAGAQVHAPAPARSRHSVRFVSSPVLQEENNANNNNCNTKPFASFAHSPKRRDGRDRRAGSFPALQNIVDNNDANNNDHSNSNSNPAQFSISIDDLDEQSSQQPAQQQRKSRPGTIDLTELKRPSAARFSLTSMSPLVSSNSSTTEESPTAYASSDYHDRRKARRLSIRTFEASMAKELAMTGSNIEELDKLFAENHGAGAEDDDDKATNIAISAVVAMTPLSPLQRKQAHHRFPSVESRGSTEIYVMEGEEVCRYEADGSSNNNSSSVTAALASSPAHGGQNDDEEDNDKTSLQEQDAYKERIEIAACLLRDTFYNRTPNHKLNKTARKLLHFKDNPIWRVFFTLVTIINIGLAFFEQPNALWPLPTGVTHGVELACLVILLVDTVLHMFLIEISLSAFFKKKWNLFRSACLVLAFIDCIGSFLVPPTSWMRFARIGRVVFFVALSSTIRSNFAHIVRSSLSMLEVLINIMYHTCFFAVLGVTLFSSIDKENFGSFVDSFLNLFVCLTTANFPDIMLPAYRANPLWSIFFIAYLLIGLYIIINRAVAVVYTHYRSSAKKEALDKYKRRRKTLWTVFKLLAAMPDSKCVQIEEWISLYKFFRPVPTMARNSDLEAIDMLLMVTTAEESPSISTPQQQDYSKDTITAISFPQFVKLCDILIAEMSIYNEVVYRLSRVTSSIVPSCFQKIRLCCSDRTSSPKLLRIIEHKAYEWVVSTLILMNCFVTIVQLSIEDYSPITARSRVFDVIDSAFLAVFTIELLIRLIAYGGIEFWKSGWNVFDFFIIVTSIASKVIIELVLTIVFASSSGSPSAIIRLLRVIRIVRMVRSIRLFSVSKRLKTIIATYIDLIQPLFYFTLMVLVVFFVYAIIGMELFGGVLVPSNKLLEGTEYASLNYYSINFNNLGAAGITLFHLLIANNWQITMFGTIAATGTYWSCLYFISFYLFAVVMLMNLVVAFFLEIFQYNWDLRQAEEKREEEEAKKKMLLQAKQQGSSDSPTSGDSDSDSCSGSNSNTHEAGSIPMSPADDKHDDAHEAQHEGNNSKSDSQQQQHPQQRQQQRSATKASNNNDNPNNPNNAVVEVYTHPRFYRHTAMSRIFHDAIVSEEELAEAGEGDGGAAVDLEINLPPLQRQQ